MFVIVEKNKGTIIDLGAVFKGTGIKTPVEYNSEGNSAILNVTEKQAQELSARSGISVQSYT